jgi:hypothetical protein
VTLSRKDLLAACAAVLLAGSRPLPDLDVAIPPGSPFDWGGMIPAITPRHEPLFPVTGSRDGPPRTFATQRADPLDLRLTSAGVLRVLTWDIEAHLPWVQNIETIEPSGVTGRGDLPGPPVVSRQIQWVCLVPLLRLMLHPALVSRAETIAHLRELGDPVLAVLDAASSETALTDFCALMEKDIRAPAKTAPAPLAGITPEETLLHRFVVRELLAAHPHDPETTFGRRLFLFGDALAPYVAAYTSDAHPLLRRNAVAALGRYRTSGAAAALVRLAVESEDPVVRARSRRSAASASRSRSTRCAPGSSGRPTGPTPSRSSRRWGRSRTRPRCRRSSPTRGNMPQIPTSSSRPRWRSPGSPPASTRPRRGSGSSGRSAPPRRSRGRSCRRARASPCRRTSPTRPTCARA